MNRLFCLEFIRFDLGILQTTVEVPDEEKKVFVGGLPHDCKHEDVKVLT